MPNWCAWRLRIKGKRSDIVKFLTEGVHKYKYEYIGKEWKEHAIPKEQLYSFDSNYIEYKKSGVYVEGTTRGFIANDICQVYIPTAKNDADVVTYVDYQQAWSVDTEELRALSEKYNLAFRMLAAEAGMGFWMDLELDHGKIIKEDIHGDFNYSKYIWECPIPDFGG